MWDGAQGKVSLSLSLSLSLSFSIYLYTLTICILPHRCKVDICTDARQSRSRDQDRGKNKIEEPSDVLQDITTAANLAEDAVCRQEGRQTLKLTFERLFNDARFLEFQ